MAYADTLARTWRDNILFNALVELTYRCNLDCSFCYNDTKLKGIPLTTAQYFEFFEDLCTLGTLNLTLSGGEPLARPDFFALGAKARELGFLVRVKSNGHALRGTLARRMRDEVDPYVIDVSLHGAGAGTHDRQTRIPGSFARLLANVREALELGLRIKLNTPLTTWNEDEIEAMYALADDLGAPIMFDTQITGRDNGDLGPLALQASRDGVARLYAIEQRRAAAHPRVEAASEPGSAPTAPEPSVAVREKHCGAGSSGITVDPYGNVYPCVQWRRRVGNLHQDSIVDLWRHSDTLIEVRGIAEDVNEAMETHGKLAFGFCPGTAEQITGHATHLYPVAKLLLDLRRRSAQG